MRDAISWKMLLNACRSFGVMVDTASLSPPVASSPVRSRPGGRSKGMDSSLDRRFRACNFAGECNRQRDTDGRARKVVGSLCRVRVWYRKGVRVLDMTTTSASLISPFEGANAVATVVCEKSLNFAIRLRLNRTDSEFMPLTNAEVRRRALAVERVTRDSEFN